MDIPSIIIKIAGACLLVWTIRSIVKQVHEQRMKKETSQDEQSVTEMALNNLILYVWLAFMIAFSIGMLLNN